MTVDDLLKDISKAAGLHRGSKEEETVQRAVVGVMGGKYKPVTTSNVLRYANKIENNLYRADDQLARRISPHLRQILNKNND